MRRKSIFIGASLLIITILITIRIFIAQPEAKKICFYPKYNSCNNYKLKDLKPNQAICFDDEETLNAFNSVTTSLLKFSIYQGGFYGTFIDKKNNPHLMIVGMSNGVIVDITDNKTYSIQNEKMLQKWYDVINTTLSKIDSLK